MSSSLSFDNFRRRSTYKLYHFVSFGTPLLFGRINIVSIIEEAFCSWDWYGKDSPMTNFDYSSSAKGCSFYTNLLEAPSDRQHVT